MDKGESVSQAPSSNVPQVLSFSDTQVEMFETQDVEISHRADTDPIESTEVVNEPKEKPSEKILDSIARDDVENTFQRLADGEFIEKKENDRKVKVDENLERDDTQDFISEEVAEKIVDDKTFEPTDGILYQEMVSAIKEGRVEEARILLDAMLLKEGHDPKSELEIPAMVQDKKIENADSQIREELVYTKEQLAKALEIMKDLTKVLKAMAEREEDEKKKASLLELLILITGFLFAYTVGEITKKSGPEPEKKEGVKIKSSLFKVPDLDKNMTYSKTSTDMI